MAAYFVAKESCPIPVLKLVKLMYLADRESMRRYGRPISYDNMVSMPNGPVLSQTYSLINGEGLPENQRIWNRWISPRIDNHTVQLQKNDCTEKDFDHFSQADVEILSAVWEEFGVMDQWQLRDYTHDNCSEWEQPKQQGKQSTPIKDIDIFRALGMQEKEAVELADDIDHERMLDMILTPS